MCSDEVNNIDIDLTVNNDAFSSENNQLCDSEFACPVDGNKEIQLASSDIEMKEPDRVAFETLSLGLVLLHARQL